MSSSSIAAELVAHPDDCRCTALECYPDNIWASSVMCHVADRREQARFKESQKKKKKEKEDEKKKTETSVDQRK